MMRPTGAKSSCRGKRTSRRQTVTWDQRRSTFLAVTDGAVNYCIIFVSELRNLRNFESLRMNHRHQVVTMCYVISPTDVSPMVTYLPLTFPHFRKQNKTMLI